MFMNSVASKVARDCVRIAPIYDFSIRHWNHDHVDCMEFGDDCPSPAKEQTYHFFGSSYSPSDVSSNLCWLEDGPDCNLIDDPSYVAGAPIWV